jgi:hypothetical protein
MMIDHEDVLSGKLTFRKQWRHCRAFARKPHCGHPFTATSITRSGATLSSGLGHRGAKQSDRVLEEVAK